MLHDRTAGVPNSPGHARAVQQGDIFRSLGVEPIINCAGTRTLYGGSNPHPDVLQAMVMASHAFVDLDELGEAAGRRISELTGAPWGIVTAGSTAALSLAVAAAIAGNDPELMCRLPYPTGTARMVLCPPGHRFAYDRAITASGGDIVTPRDLAELRQILATGDVRMICMVAKSEEDGLLRLEDIVPLARQRGTPILVDAAARSPSHRDEWLERGADLVVYSAGKFLQGPQSSGYLIGVEPLCRAAWLNGAPHQGFGRAMKIGKEEIVGALVALETWIKQGGAAHRQSQWLGQLEAIAAHVLRPGLSTKVLAPSPASLTPRLRLTWSAPIMIGSDDLRRSLLSSRPRIQLQDFWSTPNSIVIDPFNLQAGEETIVGRALAGVFDSCCEPARKPPPSSTGLAALDGDWIVQIKFTGGDKVHRFHLQAVGRRCFGDHFTRFSQGRLDGEISADGSVLLRSMHEHQPADLFFAFCGALDTSGNLEGEVELGSASSDHRGPVFQAQFGKARWRATRQSTETDLCRTTINSGDHG